MAKEGRNVLSIIFSNFFKSLMPRKLKGDLIGQDHIGNKYFEIKGATKRTTSRWFEPLGGEKNFDTELPTEWESWLRGRRSHPPTAEEIERNAKSAMSAKENAEALSAEYRSSTQDVKPPTGKVPFPKHEGYEITPGSKDLEK